MRGANLGQADLTNARLARASAAGTNLHHVNVEDVNLCEIWERGAVLAGAEASGWWWSGPQRQSRVLGLVELAAIRVAACQPLTAGSPDGPSPRNNLSSAVGPTSRSPRCWPGATGRSARTAAGCSPSAEARRIRRQRAECATCTGPRWRPSTGSGLKTGIRRPPCCWAVEPADREPCGGRYPRRRAVERAFRAQRARGPSRRVQPRRRLNPRDRRGRRVTVSRKGDPQHYTRRETAERGPWPRTSRTGRPRPVAVGEDLDLGSASARLESFAGKELLDE